MRTKIQGVVLNKLPFRERDCICRLLLRNGRQTSVLFYGGQGGGRKMKSSVVELGHLLSVELTRSRSHHQGLYGSREYGLAWQHRWLRYHHGAFYLLCFYLELISQVALVDDMSHENVDIEHQGLFRVLSNALYLLESQRSQGLFSTSHHVLTFLAKLVIELGLTPNLQHCLYSNQKLAGLSQLQLLFDQGGFADSQHVEGATGNHRGVWQVFSQAWGHSYPEVEAWARGTIEQPPVRVLYHYLLFQAHISREKIRTAPLVIME